MTFHYYGPLSPGSRLYQPRQGLDSDGQLIRDLSRYIADSCRDAADDGANCYFAINSGRQSGKTSTLLEISQHIKTDGGCPCWLDFQRVYGANPEQSVNFVARQILRTIPELGDSVQVPEEFAHGGFGFDRWLLDLPLTEEKPLVLLMEELGALPIDSRKFLGGLLRGAFNDRCNTPWNNVVLVLFGGVELYDMISVEVSPFINICRTITLLDLDSTATRSLLMAGFDRGGNSATKSLERLCKSIYAEVSGHPYLTQYLGDKSSDYYKRNGNLPEDIEMILSELQVENSDYISYLDQSIHKYDLVRITKSLLEEPTHLPADRLSIRRLELLGILGQKSGANHPFRNRLIRDSLAKILQSGQGDKTRKSPENDQNKVEVETRLIRENKTQSLFEKLSRLACLQRKEDRSDLLMRTGLEGLQPALNTEGDSIEFVTKIFLSLEKEPIINNGWHPLGLFLKVIKESLVEGEEDIINPINAFMAQYGLMEPKIHSKQKYENGIFVSYAWGSESEQTVNELEEAFARYGFRIIRDKKDLGYKDSIKEFEKRIGQGKCIILVISNKYLCSKHCMYELVEIQRNQEIQKRIFPIVMADAKIYEAIDRVKYINYWDNEIDKLNKEIKKIKVGSKIPIIYSELDKYSDIRAEFDGLSGLLSDMNALTPMAHAENGFATLITEVEAALLQIS